MDAPDRGAAGWAWLLLGLYFLSGVAGVTYEVLWVRMLSILFGASIFGVIITLAAFMSGLGLGSFAGTWLARRFSRPLAVFAILEGAVAVFAFMMPGLFASVDALLNQVAVNAPLSEWYVLQSVVAFLILFVPALALGTGFPLILKTFESTRIGLAAIYGLNTLGGALGALLPLLLLPEVGWVVSIRLIALLGLVIAVCALLIALKTGPLAGRSGDRSGRGQAPSWTTLLTYAGIGAAALILQLGWTRFYGMILLRTEYVLAIILFVFLVGLGLGSLAARHISLRHGLGWFPLAAGLFALASLWGLPLLATWADHAHFDSLADAMTAQLLALAVLTLPTTLILGAWLPMLHRHLAQEGGGTATMAGAWLYGANSVGAALGVLIAGVLLVPYMGTAATIVLAALMLFACGMKWSPAGKAWLALPLLLALAFPVATMPPVSRLLPEAHADSSDLFVQEDILSITHVVEQPDGQRLLLSDLRRMDASSEPTAVTVQKNQARLPMLLHPEPRQVLFLGLGTGITAAGALDFPHLRAEAVELSAGAIEAADAYFSPVNDKVMSRIDVSHDDARRYLRATAGRYDVIVGDLFHPDLVGRSNLLSIQQFRRARQRLRENGLFVQWLALNQFDTRSLETVLRSFQSVFPQAVLFIDGFRLAMVGPNSALGGAPSVLANLARMDEVRQQAVTGGEGAWTWLGRYWGPVALGSGPVQDEWAPRIEFSLPQLRYTQAQDMNHLIQRLLQQRPSVEMAGRTLRVPPEKREQFERAYIASELAMRSMLATLNGKTEEARKLMRFAYDANPRDRWVGFDIADSMFASLEQAASMGMDRRQALTRILSIRPDHAGAVKALWKLERDAGNQEQADNYLLYLRELSPLDAVVREEG